jgi:hypothetical protein
MTIENKEQLYVFRDFIGPSELEFWNKVMDEASFWEGASHHPGIVDYYRDAMPPDLADAEADLVQRICKKAESVYGEDLITEQIPSFRRYMTGGKLNMHYDHGDSLWVDEEFEFGFNDHDGIYWPRGLNEYSTSLYWNSDFEGGEICFQNPSISIKPEAGMLLMFPCNEQYAHEVREVTAGERRTTSHFWSRARTVVMITANPKIGHRTDRRFMEKVERLRNSRKSGSVSTN